MVLLFDITTMFQILNVIWLLLSISLFVFSFNQLMRKTTRRIDKKRNSALTAIFGSIAVIVSFFVRIEFFYWIAPALGAISLYHFILFLESSESVFKKKVEELDTHVGLICAILFFCDQMAIESLVFMVTGGQMLTFILFHWFLAIAMCTFAIFLPKILDKQISYKPIWKKMLET